MAMAVFRPSIYLGHLLITASVCGLVLGCSVAAGSLAPIQMLPLTFHDFATGHDPIMAAMPFLLA